MSRLNPALPHRIAADAEALHKPEHHVRSLVGEAYKAAADVGSKEPFDGVRVLLEAGDHLPAIAPRGPPAGALGFKYHHLPASRRSLRPRGRAAGNRHSPPARRDRCGRPRIRT